MKIDSHDIIRAARQLRDEQNGQLHVRPWSRRRHFHIPTWLVAIPAAAIVGFALGIWTQSHPQSEMKQTALVDTVYIHVHEPQDSSIAVPLPSKGAAGEHHSTDRRSQGKSIHRTARKAAVPRPSVGGRPVADDHIRYDLLVIND